LNWVDIKGLTSADNTTTTWYPTQNWWWWRAARIVPANVPETITEFPFFSFLLGDLHPHVMAIPFGILGVAAAVRLLQEDEVLDLPFWAGHQLLLVALAILVGGLSFLNTWDLPTFFFLLVVAALIRNFLVRKRWDWTLLKQNAGFAVPPGSSPCSPTCPITRRSSRSASPAGERNCACRRNGTKPFHTLVFWARWPCLSCRLRRSGSSRRWKERAWRNDDWSVAAPGLAIVGIWLLGSGPRPPGVLALPDRGSAWITAIILVAILTLLVAALRREIESFAALRGLTRRRRIACRSRLRALLVLGAEFYFIKDVLTIA
jgi:hypothetical protein